MSAEENKRIVGRFWEEVFNGGDLGVANGLFSDQHKMLHPYFPEDRRGAGPVKRFVAVSRKVSPDLTVRVEDEIAEGDKVVTRWSAEGTLAERLCAGGEGANSVAATGVAIFRVSGGMIEETWLRLEPSVAEPELPAPKEDVREWLVGDATVPDGGRNPRPWGAEITPGPLPGEDPGGPGEPGQQPAGFDETDLRWCCLWDRDCCNTPDPGGTP